MNLKMESRNSWEPRALFKIACRLACLVFLFLPFCWAQSNVLSAAPPEKVTVRRGDKLEVKTVAILKPGYHVNSNTPSEAYLIPLKLSWEPGPLEAIGVEFPKAQMEKYAFSEKPLSVFSGDFELVTKFKAAAGASSGPGLMVGKLR